jgi:hypothetical protein
MKGGLRVAFRFFHAVTKFLLILQPQIGKSRKHIDMKRFTMTMALLLAVAMPMMAERVTPETARKVATTFLQNNGAKTTQMAELSKSVGFDNLYIFTTESSFVVMSADDCVKPILGYSFDGKFEVEGMPENVRGWLKGYNDGIQYIIENNIKPTTFVKNTWNDLANGKEGISKATPIVNPMVQTQWNQGSPYNNLCPTISNERTVTGCVATAMAQVMKYWNHPTTGTSSHSYQWNSQTLSANFGATNYDWSNMTNTYNSNSTNTQKNAVATLMYHCGVSIEMNYGINASGASTYSVMSALQTYFSYAPCMQYKSKDDYDDEVWISMLKNELNDGRPLQYRGSDAGGGGGHSFVCDGYDSDDYLHFNWGWGGYCDGFYDVNNLEPGTGGIGAGNGVYTVGESAIFGIEPISTLASPILSATTSEGIATLTWTAIEGATSYVVYKNNVKIVEDLTCTTYCDEGLSFGVNYEYHVRAVDGETRSNPSNTVTIQSNYRDITPSNLTATYNEDGVTLEWTGYEGGLSTDLHYGLETGNQIYGYSGNSATYWAQKYLASTLSNLSGMMIHQVSFYAAYTGTYTLYLFKGNTSNNNNLLWTQSCSVTEQGWNNFEIPSGSLVPLNVTQDLWVVLSTDASISYPALCGPYSGENVVNARYISDVLSNWSYINSNVSWLIRTYLSDGTYTYNLYDNEIKLNGDSPISETSYTIETPTNNTAHQYTVKTNYYGGESPASNMAGFTLGSASIASLELGSNDKMTLTQNSKLTVSGDLINTNPDNLILEDGAQLIHNSDNVAATVKKAIAPYTANDNGWYFIASPVTETITPSEENGFLNGTVGQDNNTYDFYYYYEPEYLWKNYEATAFNIVHKQGYLYANGETEGTTLQFAGTLIPSNNSVTVNNLSHSATILNGFNLVGNPFVCNATVNMDFYVIDNTTNDIVLPPQNTVIAPCEGVFVQASAENTSVTFSKANAAKSDNPKDCFDIIVTQNKANLDRARVRFGKGTGMEKYSLDDKHTQISLYQDGQNYAVAYLNGYDEMPLNFKAKENGTYTLSIETQDLDLSYLHLIDNLTGNNVDLLATPSYTFKATTNDYISRFKLVFNNGTTTDSEAFAFIGNGNIIISHEGKGDLQIVDMTGRIIASYDGHIQCVPTSGMAPGVYVLRLIDNENVKTQKIVIE